jgi:excisionase family DNA binding protein
MEGLVSAEQLSEAWGLSRSLVYKLIRQKDIPFYRICKCVRFSPSEVAKWLEERRNKGFPMERKLRRPLDGGISGQK